MENETGPGGGNVNSTIPLEDEGNVYLVDFAYGAFLREKEFYAAIYAILLVAALPLALFVATAIIL